MTEASEKKICGIVMPISECDGRPPSHWADVLSIIKNSATSAGFEARLVSETFETNLIHKEILRNIYQDEIVVCDVSGRNPNVFFELGIRMATQKPTIVIKDNATIYPFDTSVNRYIEYPRDLRHPLVENFKKELSDMIIKVSNQKPEMSFIGQLGPFQIPNIESTEISASEAILAKLDRIEANAFRSSNNFMADIKYTSPSEKRKYSFKDNSDGSMSLFIQGIDLDQISLALKNLREQSGWKFSCTEVFPVDGSFLLRIEGQDAHQNRLKGDISTQLEKTGDAFG